MVNSHGGKRVGAGRKELPDSLKKKTVVVRVDESLVPIIDRLKYCDDIVTINQVQLANIRKKVDDLHTENTQLKHTIAQLKELKPMANTPLRANQCQAITRTGNRCTKVGIHENAWHGALIMTCERHYQSMINKGVAHD